MSAQVARLMAELGVSAIMRAELEHHILSGAWQVGDRIPTEHALMVQYDCSRMTVSKVLGALAERGLLVRRRRAGSFVAAPPASRAVLKIEDFAEEAARTGRRHRHTVHDRARRPATEVEAITLHIPAGDPLLEVTCLHEFDDVPVAWERRLIRLASVPAAANADFRMLSPGAWLLRHVPWSVAEHEITALAAHGELAARLVVAPGSACLGLHRRTWNQGALVTDVLLVFPGSRYRFTGRFSPTEPPP